MSSRARESRGDEHDDDGDGDDGDEDDRDTDENIRNVLNDVAGFRTRRPVRVAFKRQRAVCGVVSCRRAFVLALRRNTHTRGAPMPARARTGSAACARGVGHTRAD